jgi:N-acetylglutamate synthase-like GNAT family acetyltransferase
MTNLKIRVATQKDSALLTEIIRTSFEDVAECFGLTTENCPRHASNCKVDWIEKDMNRGITYFILEEAGRASGCVALEKVSDELCYLERLAVLPDRRLHGLGKVLVDHVLDEAKLSGAKRLSIGTIAEQTELGNWYRKIGFAETETKEFTHLPFQVRFMSYEIKLNCIKSDSAKA